VTLRDVTGGEEEHHNGKGAQKVVPRYFLCCGVFPFSKSIDDVDSISTQNKHAYDNITGKVIVVARQAGSVLLGFVELHNSEYKIDTQYNSADCHTRLENVEYFTTWIID
jgi:hypothetical protein